MLCVWARDEWVEQELRRSMVTSLDTRISDLSQFAYFRNEHVKHSPKCVYLIKKKSYDHKITIRDFVEIEKHRYLFLNVRMIFVSVSEEFIYVE